MGTNDGRLQDDTSSTGCRTGRTKGRSRGGGEGNRMGAIWVGGWRSINNYWDLWTLRGRVNKKGKIRRRKEIIAFVLSCRRPGIWSPRELYKKTPHMVFRQRKHAGRLRDKSKGRGDPVPRKVIYQKGTVNQAQIHQKGFWVGIHGRKKQQKGKREKGGGKLGVIGANGRHFGI